MAKDQEFSDKLYQHYREFIEFFNDLQISKGVAITLMTLPNLTIITDLLLNFEKQSMFEKFTYLGGSQIFIKMINAYASAGFFIIAISFILIFLPFLIILSIIIETLLKNPSVQTEQGEFRRKYETSMISKATGIFILTYPDICFPILVSTGIKFQQLDDLLLKVSGVLILIFCIFTLFISEYYTLEIKSKNIHTGLINFPNSLIDKAVVFSVIISINCTSGVPSFVIGLSSYLIRTFIALYFKFYRLYLYENHMFSLLACGNLCIGLLLAYISGEHMILMIATAFISVILFRIKARLFQGRKLNKYEEYKELKEKEPEVNEVQELKTMLWEEGHFTFVFRELLFCSRKNNSHRNQLALEILKSKCYRMESQSRGGTKVLSALDVLSYESYIIDLITNIILISDKSISLLTFIQKKQPSIEMFLQRILELVFLIQTSKQKLQKCMRIHHQAFQGKYMLKLLFEDLHQDSQFQKGLQEIHREYIFSTTQKFYREKLFNSKTAVIFINALDEVGKITRISNNLVDVLGFSAHHLTGLLINEIIPYSLKRTHSDSILNYIRSYGQSQFRKDPFVQFYAYTKDLFLQEIKLTYNFIMNYFGDFQLSGVLRKIDSNQAVIVTDYYGNLEGWTKSANEIFPFDDLVGSEYSLFNPIVLFPALPKHMPSSGVCFETLVFKTSKLKNQALCLMDPKKDYPDENQIWKKQIQAFYKILEMEQIVEIYLIKLQMETVSFVKGEVKMRKILLQNPRKVENIDSIISKVLFSESKSEAAESQMNEEVRSLEKEEQEAQYSIIAEDLNENTPPDFNFTLNWYRKERGLKPEDILLSREGNCHTQSFVTMQDISNANTQREEDLQSLGGAGERYIHESIFNPKIQRQSNYVYFIVLLTIIFISLIIYDITSLDAAEKLMESECQKMKKRNRAFMIYAKSIFNPNASYISEFNNARLFDHSARLLKSNFTYITAYGYPIDENKYYMFNVQIPSTLDRVVYTKDSELQKTYTNELEYNFYKVVEAYEHNFQESITNWEETIEHVSTTSIIRISVIAFGSVIYVVFLLFLYHQFSKQRKMMEAFFKFQKIDLEARIEKIHFIVDELEKKVGEWHFEKYYFDFLKQHELPFLKIAPIFQSSEKQIASQQKKRKGGGDNKKDEYIDKKKSPLLILGIVLFILTQILFLSIYGSLASVLLNDFKEIPSEVNDACKLTVYPNLQLGSLIYEAPEHILKGYKAKIDSLLEKPTDRLPKLFPLLEEAPCSECKFWNAVLRTNFRSFYSTFEEFIAEKKNLGQNNNINDAFFSVDVVTERVLSALSITELPIIEITVLLYLFSLVVFYVLIYLEIRKMNNENDKLEVFLKYFNEETVQKNKHMSAVLKKNI